MGTRTHRDIQHRWALEASIEIDAPPVVVWEIMTNFDHTAWAPTGIKSIRGEFVDGGKATVVYRLCGIPTWTRRRLKVNPGTGFGWDGHAAPGLLDDHAFLLTPLDDGTRTLVTQTDRADGRLGRLFGRFIVAIEAHDDQRWNKALKAQVEAFQELSQRIEEASSSS